YLVPFSAPSGAYSHCNSDGTALSFRTRTLHFMQIDPGPDCSLYVTQKIRKEECTFSVSSQGIASSKFRLWGDVYEEMGMVVDAAFQQVWTHKSIPDYAWREGHSKISAFALPCATVTLVIPEQFHTTALPGAGARDPATKLGALFVRDFPRVYLPDCRTHTSNTGYFN
ncbi:hypothetical protein STEG23_024106, partial [Scotinomys teguina]